MQKTLGLIVSSALFFLGGCSDSDDTTSVPEIQVPAFEKGLTPALHQATTEYLARGSAAFQFVRQDEAATIFNEVLTELRAHQSKLVGENPARPLSNPDLFSPRYGDLLRAASEGCTAKRRNQEDQPGGAGVSLRQLVFDGVRCASELNASATSHSTRIRGLNGRETSETRRGGTWEFSLSLATEKENLEGLVTPVEFTELDPIAFTASGSFQETRRPLKNDNYSSPGQSQASQVYTGTMTTLSGQDIGFRYSMNVSSAEVKKFEGESETSSRMSTVFAIETPYGNYVHQKTVVRDPTNIEEPVKTTVTINGVEVTVFKN